MFRFVHHQIWRVNYLLNPDPESVIGRVFNLEWLDGSKGTIFPIAISHSDVTQFLPHYFKQGNRFYLPFPMLKETKQAFRESIYRNKVVMMELTEEHTPTLEDNLVTIFSEKVGEHFTSYDLNQLLENLEFYPGNPNKVRELNRVLKPEGLSITKTRKRVGGERISVYEVKEVKVTPTDMRQYDYDKAGPR